MPAPAGSFAEAFRGRTRRYAIAVVRLVRSLPRDGVAWVLGKQLLRAGTSVGANYRAACRARSRADFIAKMKVVEEEADESLFWLDLLTEAGLSTAASTVGLRREGEEILAMTVASIRTARARLSADS